MTVSCTAHAVAATWLTARNDSYPHHDAHSVRNLEICEVPGNRDSTVLGPSVRVLVGLLRRSVSTQ